MTMKFHRFLLLALLPITAMFAACNHDEGETMLELHAERFGGQKMTVQDNMGAWSNGDSVWINGQNYRISIDNNGHAVVSVPTAPSYNAVFPASIKRDGNKVCLPAEYHYTTEGGRQVLNLPMVASSDGSNGLFFNHLTGALIVKFSNDRSESVVVDRITVHCAHPLCGTFEISDTTLSPSGATDTSITMYFDRQEVLLANHNTIAVMLPIVPVNSAQFTVKVSCHVNGDRYSDSTRQANQHDFERNRLGYAFMKVDNSIITPLALFSNQGNGPTRVMNIYNASDFLLMHKAINNGWTYGGYSYAGFSYVIHSDIDLSGIILTPISNFTGLKFDGGGNTISHLSIRNNSSENCALFESITGTTKISNIKLSEVTLESSGTTTTRRISPLVGRFASSVNISNCTTHVSNVIVSSTNDIFFGGIAAITETNVTFINCKTSIQCSLYANNRIYYGGIVGQAEKNDTCQSCISSNNISLETNSSNIFAGGAIGHGKTNSRLLFNSTNCIDSINAHTNSGKIHLGGLVGYLYKDNSGLLVNTCTISGLLSTSSNGTNPIYVGTIYGYGSLKNRYLFNTWSYIISSLEYPDTEGIIISGDPTGNY